MTFAAIAAAASVAVSARADDTFPVLETEILFELQNDLIFDSEDPAAELNDLYTTIEPAFSLRVAPWLSLNAGLTFEPVEDPTDDRAFEDEGLYVEQLFAAFTFDQFEIYAGKFNPGFGIAWDQAPGVYGVDFAEDYEVTEKIGLGGALTFGANEEGEGGHRLAAAIFYADTTALSESAFTNRGRVRELDGGVSNTEDLSSFTVSIDGPLSDNFSYHAAFRHLAAGVTETDDENGFVGGVYGEIEFQDDVVLAPVAEIVYLDNADGLDQSRLYLTTGVRIGFGQWNVSVSNTVRSTDADDPLLESPDDDLLQASVGYEFDNGIGIDVGYLRLDEDQIESNGIGILIGYVWTPGGED